MITKTEVNLHFKKPEKEDEIETKVRQMKIINITAKINEIENRENKSNPMKPSSDSVRTLKLIHFQADWSRKQERRHKGIRGLPYSRFNR